MTTHGLILEVLEGLAEEHEGAVPAQVARAALEGLSAEPFEVAVETAGFRLAGGFVSHKPL